MMRRCLLLLVLVAAAGIVAAHAAPAPALAQTPPGQDGHPLNRGGRLHVLPVKGSGVNPSAPRSATAAVGSCALGCSPPLAYHGGPVVQASTTYAIFWLPNGSHYEQGGNDSRYENLVSRYFSDVGGSSLYKVLTQYSLDPTTGATVTDGPILNSSTFGGSWIDTSDYGGKGSTSNPLLDTDIQAEVAKAINANHWTASLTTMFFVYTGLGVQSCIDTTHTTCTFASQTQYCAYHSNGDGVDAPSSVLYANMPDMTACAQLLPASPNGDLNADSAINLTSHEHFEAVTDPYLTAWYDDGLYGYEIGDECAWMFGPVSNGGDVTLNGHPYIVQEEWSNASSACTLSYGGPTAPGAPSNVSATAGDGQATVSWAASTSNGGSPISGYTVTSTPGGKTATAAGNATSVVVSGLTDGTSYTFTVHAGNAVGSSGESGPSNMVTPSATPPMSISGSKIGGNLCTCNILTASVGGIACTTTLPLTYNASFALQAGCGTAGQAVTFALNGMPVGLSTSTGQGCLAFAPGTSVTGLQVSTGYTQNTSCATTGGAPTAPGAPANVTATAGNGQATVSWTAPPSNGGSPITGYTVTSSPGGKTATVSVSATSAVVTGLSNGTSYTFTVTATNAVGTGPASSPSNAVTPSGPTAPGAPGNVTATAGNGQATVSWTAPSNSGGSAITAYTVTTSPGGLTATAAGNATSATVGGLTNGTGYTFTVTAANAAGIGPASAASNMVTPSATAPMSISGSKIGGNLCTCNVLTAFVGGVACTNTVPLTYNASFALQVGCGTAGQAVTFAVNGTPVGLSTSTGQGCLAFAPGTAANGVQVSTGYTQNTSCATVPGLPTAPGAPANVTATAGNGQATVSWAAPSNNGGSPITGYAITSSPGGVTVTAAGSATSAAVAPLTNGTSYTFTVTATNAIGTGPASTPSNAVTPSAPVPPGAPSNVSATAGDGQATVNWTTPASNGGSPITAYTITSSPGGLTATASGSATSAVVSGLVDGTNYTFTVTAANAIGTGPVSAVSNMVTPSSTSPMSISGSKIGGNLCTCNVLTAFVGGVACTTTLPLTYNASFSLQVGCGAAGQAVTFAINGTQVGLSTSTGFGCLAFAPGTTVTGVQVSIGYAQNTSCATALAPAGSAPLAVTPPPATVFERSQADAVSLRDAKSWRPPAQP
jgi:hypothetical protein